MTREIPWRKTLGVRLGALSVAILVLRDPPDRGRLPDAGRDRRRDGADQRPRPRPQRRLPACWPSPSAWRGTRGTSGSAPWGRSADVREQIDRRFEVRPRGDRGPRAPADRARLRDLRRETFWRTQIVPALDRLTASHDPATLSALNATVKRYVAEMDDIQNEIDAAAPLRRRPVPDHPVRLPPLRGLRVPGDPLPPPQRGAPRAHPRRGGGAIVRPATTPRTPRPSGQDEVGQAGRGVERRAGDHPPSPGRREGGARAHRDAPRRRRGDGERHLGGRGRAPRRHHRAGGGRAAAGGRGRADRQHRQRGRGDLAAGRGARSVRRRCRQPRGRDRARRAQGGRRHRRRAPLGQGPGAGHHRGHHGPRRAGPGHRRDHRPPSTTSPSRPTCWP